MVKALKSYGLYILNIKIVIGTIADSNKSHEAAWGRSKLVERNIPRLLQIKAMIIESHGTLK